jgi:MFS superfamily sulfate permease-like transporter
VPASISRVSARTLRIRALERPRAEALTPFAFLRGYRPAWVANDAIAGLVLVAIAIPEQLATARLAGFPPDAGLSAFVVATVAFAAVGANRYLSAGADSTIAPIFAASLGAIVATGSSGYLADAGALALLVGAILAIVGVARAGWLADLLSVPVTIGFLAGIGFRIVVGELPALLGIAAPVRAPVMVLADVLGHLREANPATCALGIGVLALTVVCARVSERIPGPLLGLIASGVAVATLGLESRGVAVLGKLDVRMPVPHLPALAHVSELVTLAPLALVVAAVCVLQTSAVARSFPGDTPASDGVDADFVALGLGNALAGLAGAFPVDASPPRTALVHGAGGRSQLSGLVAVAALIAIVAFFARYAAYVPEAALAGVLVTIGARIFRVGDMRKIARCSPNEIYLVLAGALLVIALPIQTGMLLAIVLSLAHGVTLVMWPASTQLFRVRDTTVWWPPTGEKNTVDVPGVVVFAPAAPINFTNADFVMKKLLAAVSTSNARAPVTLCVIEASGITDIDYTGSQALQATIATLRARHVEVALARLIATRARAAAERSGLLALVGVDHVFLSVEEAFEALHPATG